MIKDHQQKLRDLLMNTVLEFCRKNSCFEEVLQIQGTLCVTSDASSFFVTQISEKFNATDSSRSTPSDSLSPPDLQTTALVFDQNDYKNDISNPVFPLSVPLSNQQNTPTLSHMKFLKRISTNNVSFLAAKKQHVGNNLIKVEPISPINIVPNTELTDQGTFTLQNQKEGLVSPKAEDFIPIEYDQYKTSTITDSHFTPTKSKTRSLQGFSHYIKKNPPDKFSCLLCGCEYSNRGSIYRHVEKHLGRSYTCEFCGQQFESHSGWSRHLRNKHVQHMSFECSICGEKFWQQPALDQHNTRVHSQLLFAQQEAAHNAVTFTGQSLQLQQKVQQSESKNTLT